MNTLELISEYLASVKKYKTILQNHFGQKNLLQGWRSGSIPQSGEINSSIAFQFHGSGCTVEHGEIEISFDFGFDNDLDGFDLWRLTNYAECFPVRYSKILSGSTLEDEFNDLIEKKVIVNPNRPPSPHLYFLAHGKDF